MTDPGWSTWSGQRSSVPPARSILAGAEASTGDVAAVTRPDCKGGPGLVADAADAHEARLGERDAFDGGGPADRGLRPTLRPAVRTSRARARRSRRRSPSGAPRGTPGRGRPPPAPRTPGTRRCRSCAGQRERASASRTARREGPSLAVASGPPGEGTSETSGSNRMSRAAALAKSGMRCRRAGSEKPPWSRARSRSGAGRRSMPECSSRARPRAEAARASQEPQMARCRARLSLSGEETSRSR